MKIDSLVCGGTERPQGSQSQPVSNLSHPHIPGAILHMLKEECEWLSSVSPTVPSLKGCLGCQQGWLHRHRMYPLHFCGEQIFVIKEASHTMSTSAATWEPALQTMQFTTLPSEVAFPTPATEILHPYPICFQSSCQENPSIGPSGKASAQFLLIESPAWSFSPLYKLSPSNTNCRVTLQLSQSNQEK